eukprot:3090767-Rhodomonas_salina.1
MMTSIAHPIAVHPPLAKRRAVMEVHGSSPQSVGVFAATFRAASHGLTSAAGTRRGTCTPC